TKERMNALIHSDCCRLDVQDIHGCWLDAEIYVHAVKESLSVHVHYVGWESKWDEWIDVYRHPLCFASSGTFTLRAPDATRTVFVGERVLVYIDDHKYWQVGWVCVTKGREARVKFKNTFA